MNDNNTYFEQIDAYLDGELQGTELSAFESELASNESLATEISSQKELIEGINSYRSSQLIARFENLPVSTGSITTGSIAKIVGSVIIIGSIGFGLFQWMTPEEVIAPEAIVPITEDPIKKDITPKEVTEQSETVEVVDAKEQPKETRTEPRKSVEKDDDEPNEEAVSTPVVTPVVPNPILEDDSEVGEELEIPEAIIGNSDVTKKSGMEVDIISDSKYAFHYKVVRSNLTLYGNFNEEPYQIIEINVNKEKHLYLYFKESYYSIDKTSNDITPLSPISNKSMILELEKRKNQDS